MRRICSFAIAALSLALVGCGGTGDSNDGPRLFVLSASKGSPLIDYTLHRVDLDDLSSDVVGEQESRLFAGLDIRPATGELYTYDASNDSVYKVDMSDGDLTLVGSTPTNMTESPYVLDFNPVVDRIRLINANNAENFRLNPDNASIAGTDTTLSPVTQVADLAYTNNFAGATVTTLYGIDGVNNTLIRIGGVDGTPSPNGGVVTTIGSLGIGTNRVAGFEITPDGTAYLLVQNLADEAILYTVNLTTGAATQVGVIDNLDGTVIMGLAYVE